MVDVNTYLTSLIGQIRAEKQSFDSCLNFTLIIAIGASAAWGKYCFGESPQRFTAFLIAGTAFIMILALFLRSVRAHRNYHRYMWLKGEVIKESTHIFGNNADLSTELQAQVKGIDIKRGLLGSKIKKYGMIRMILHCFWRNCEYAILITAFIAMEYWASKGIECPQEVKFTHAAVVIQCLLSAVLLIKQVINFEWPIRENGDTTEANR